DFCTQRQRGRGYAALVRAYWNAQTPRGIHFVVGLDWWAWADQVTNGENMNFGLVDLHDHPYDGRETVFPRAHGCPGPCVSDERLDEQKESGDFLGSVVRANRGILIKLMAAVHGHVRRGAKPPAPSRNNRKERNR
ncbi:MAG TPA: hypothetical protein VNJ12_01315, partial [Candidatus Dormibacteraeota bacterium]|nr:hypothetical protein [Candidatus Dormibacteraeota bacterium]